MIRITKVEITNYRSCLKTKLEFHKDLTSLIGINGVGKSNILNAVQLLKKIRRERTYSRDRRYNKEIEASFSNTVLKFELQIEKDIYILKADVLFETDDKNVDDIYSAKLLIRKKNKRVRKYRWEKVPLDFFDYLERNLINNSSYFGRHYQSFGNKVALRIAFFFKTISYYSATQFSDPTKCPISLELENMRVLRQGAAKPHDKFMYDLYNSYKRDDGSFKAYLNTVGKAGIGLVDDISFLQYEMPTSSYEVRAGGKIKKSDRTKFLIIPNFTIDGANFSPNQLSEGTFKTLALVFYIIRDRSQLLLIEEPEVCVHHGLLNSILELIKFQASEKQIVISTHSDFVLDKLMPENIVLVSKDTKVGTLTSPLSKSMAKNEYRALKAYLEESGNLGEYWKEGGLDDA